MQLKDGRIARKARFSRAHGDLCAELLEALQHDRIGVDGDEDAEPPPTGRGDDRRRQRGVPAAGDRQVAAPGSIDEPDPLGDLEPDQHAEQVARLVRAGHVARFVLDPDAATLRETEPVAELVAARERRGREPVTVDGGDAVVEGTPPARSTPRREYRCGRRGRAFGSEGTGFVPRPASGKETADGSSSRRSTWSTSPCPAFGQRNGYGSAAGGEAPQPAQTRRVASRVAVAVIAPRARRSGR